MASPSKSFNIIAWCNYCDGKIETHYPKEWVACKCGKSYIDAGDEYYARYGGDLRHEESHS